MESSSSDFITHNDIYGDIDKVRVVGLPKTESWEIVVPVNDEIYINLFFANGRREARYLKKTGVKYVYTAPENYITELRQTGVSEEGYIL